MASLCEGSIIEQNQDFQNRFTKFAFKHLFKIAQDPAVVEQTLKTIIDRYADLPEDMEDDFILTIGDIMTCMRGAIGLIAPWSGNYIDDANLISQKKNAHNLTSIIGSFRALIVNHDLFAPLLITFAVMSTSKAKGCVKQMVAACAKLKTKEPTLEELTLLCTDALGWQKSLKHKNAFVELESIISSRLEHHAAIAKEAFSTQAMTKDVAKLSKEFREVCIVAQACQLLDKDLSLLCKEVVGECDNVDIKYKSVGNQVLLSGILAAAMQDDHELGIEFLESIAQGADKCQGVELSDALDMLKVADAIRLIISVVLLASPDHLLEEPRKRWDMAAEAIQLLLAFDLGEKMKEKAAAARSAFAFAQAVAKATDVNAHICTLGDTDVAQIDAMQPRCEPLLSLKCAMLEAEKWAVLPHGDYKFEAMWVTVQFMQKNLAHFTKLATTTQLEETMAKRAAVDSIVSLADGNDSWLQDFDGDKMDFVKVADHSKTNLLKMPAVKFADALSNLENQLSRTQDVYSLFEIEFPKAECDLTTTIIQHGKALKATAVFLSRFVKNPEDKVALRKIAVQKKKELNTITINAETKATAMTLLPAVICKALNDAAALKNLVDA